MDEENKVEETIEETPVEETAPVEEALDPVEEMVADENADPVEASEEL